MLQTATYTTCEQYTRSERGHDNPKYYIGIVKHAFHGNGRNIRYFHTVVVSYRSSVVSTINDYTNYVSLVKFWKFHEVEIV